MSYIVGCGDMSSPLNDCCQVVKTGRIAKIAFYKQPFVDKSDPVEWAAKVAAGTAVKWLAVNGELAEAEKTDVAGYGQLETMVAGTKSTITYRVPYDYLNNTAFRALRNARSWFVAYTFEGEPDVLWIPATQVSVFGSPRIEASMQGVAEATITVMWSNDEFPEYVAIPSGLFDC